MRFIKIVSKWYFEPGRKTKKGKVGCSSSVSARGLAVVSPGYRGRGGGREPGVAKRERKRRGSEPHPHFIRNFLPAMPEYRQK
jgi:hypothetical protein